MDRFARQLALALAVAWGSLVPVSGRAEAVDASSTTMMIVRDQARSGTSYVVAPLYEILSVSARDIENPLAQHLSVVFSGWGAVSVGPNLVWYDADPPRHNVFADLDLAYLQGEFLGRDLQIRAGRMLVTGGVTRSLQLDGASAALRAPFGLGLSAYVGSPVAQRFEARGPEPTFNPQLGNFAVGGRAWWTVARWGEIGVSGVRIGDHGDPSRQQIGVDLRATPWRPLTLLASTSYDVYEDRWAETTVLGRYQVLPKLLVDAEYRHVEPDLFLPRDSILAVFTLERRNEAGGGVQLEPMKAVTLHADYHFLRNDGDGDGHRVSGRATWRPASGAAVGVELGQLRAVDGNGYFQARAFGSAQVRRLQATLDVQEYAFRRAINGEDNSFVANATLRYLIGGGFSALVSGSGGVTPYYARRFDVLAKVAYDQSYQKREGIR